MVKTPMRCPFNNKLCIECHLYRGRHYYLCNCEHYRGYIKPKNKVKENAFEPKIKLKIIDMESGKESTCEPAEAKAWKWDDPSIMRFIIGAQVDSWKKLAEIMRYQEEKGATVLTIYEGPRFMLIAGG